MLGLVLTAGGARGAYQAGVLKRISELSALRGATCPFPIITGASAGAINGTIVASGCDDFRRTTNALVEIWSRLLPADVFRVDALSLGSSGARMVLDMVTGGRLPGAGTAALFDSTPLRALLTRSLPVEGIAAGIARGHLHALAITATSYHSGRSYTFIQGRPGHALWRKSRRVTLSMPITADHVYASAAIPIVFAPARLPGEGPDLFFGDGGLRLVTPFSPAIRLGATHVMAIGIRSHHAAQTLAAAELGSPTAGATPTAPIRMPPLAQICGVFMNAIFLDHLDTDLDHLLRMNAVIASVDATASTNAAAQEPIRTVTPLVVNPSQDLAIVAKSFAHRMPRIVRWLMDGLGTPDAESADLMSYLLFDREYTQALIDIGYSDAARRINDIEAFLHEATAAAAPLARRAM